MPEQRPKSAVIERFSTREGNRWTHSPLSNGFVEPDGSHVEGEYQAYAKTTNDAERRRILFMPGGNDREVRRPPFGPVGAKQAGRRTTLRPDHNEVKVPVMAFFVGRKFAEHPICRDHLLATGQAYLVEGNTWHDNYWGDCRCGDEPCRAPGVNALGIILMAVRASLSQRSITGGYVNP